MKIVAISDMHSKLPVNLPKGDVLVIAGDMTFNGRHDYVSQAGWLNKKFYRWLERHRPNFKRIIGIAGNHDSVFDNCPGLVNPLPWTYLEDSGCQVDGVYFWGTPWSRPFCDWGFNRDAKFRELAFSQIPETTDILISHTPPANCGLIDACSSSHVGDEVLGAHIYRTKPKVVICGHIHEGGGLTHTWDDIGTTFYNVSILNLNYEVANKPAIIEI